MTSKPEDSRIPSAASAWTKETLAFLNAEYSRKVCTTFSFPGLAISTKLQESKSHCRRDLSLEIDTVATELGRVNNSEEITSEFEFDEEDHPILAQFVSSFNDLRNILRRREQATEEPSTPTQITSPTETPINSPERGAQHQGSPTSTISNRSAKHEHHTDAFANDTLKAAYNSLKKYLTQEIAWFDSKSEAAPTYSISMMSLILSSGQTMKMKLGSVEVTAKSDGGITFHPKASSSSGYPILCIEV